MITMMEPLSSETQPATYGAKGAGEIACVPPMACIANAIFNATGVRINKLPLSPENVLRGLKAAGKP